MATTMSPEAPFSAGSPSERHSGSSEGLFPYAQSGEYKILQDQNNPELRTEYVHLTERLISRILTDKIDDVVFLDKSARPVAWLMKALWPTLGTDADGQLQPMPEIKFANIDREQWGPFVGRSEDKEGGINIDNLPIEVIDSLRGLFAERSMEFAESATGESTMFDDRHLLIVDEVKTSGDTLEIANRLFTKAFPNAKVDQAYWLPPMVKTVGGVRKNADTPVWYDKEKIKGRLVSNRDFNKSRKSVSKRQRRGQFFLGTRFSSPDEEGVKLRHEMQQLGDEVAQGLIPVAPGRESADWTDEQLEGFMQRVNGISLDEFVRLKREAEQTKEPFTELFQAYKRDKAIREQ